jgi:hypothetical protein
MSSNAATMARAIKIRYGNIGPLFTRWNARNRIRQPIAKNHSIRLPAVAMICQIEPDCLKLNPIASRTVKSDFNLILCGFPHAFGWCQRRELNPRPKAYESSALPLSYSGLNRKSISRTTALLSNAFGTSLRLLAQVRQGWR